MRFVILGLTEEGLIGRNQRKPFRISEVNEWGCAGALLRRAVALQFDIEPVAEQAHELAAARAGELELSRADRQIQATQGAAGKRNHAFGFTLEPSKVEMRRPVLRR